MGVCVRVRVCVRGLRGRRLRIAMATARYQPSIRPLGLTQICLPPNASVPHPAPFWSPVCDEYIYEEPEIVGDLTDPPPHTH